MRAVLEHTPDIAVVAEADNGVDAVDRVETLLPDVVLIDVRMPMLDGLEATRRIKGRWPQVRVVVLTLYETYHAAALAAGADTFLLKGCATADLLDVIRTPDARAAAC